MKTFGLIAAILTIGGAAMADTIVAPGATFVGVPLNFQTTTGSNTAPFWNNNSLDGLLMNAGYFLTGSNATLGATDYLGTGGQFGNYLSTGSAGLDAPSNFSFLQSALTADYQLLYSNAGANMTSTYGTSIGLYNVADPSQKIVLYDHGTLYNPASGSGGVYNNNFSAMPVNGTLTFANYGFYATTCGYNTNHTIYCDTHYSNDALDITSESSHQHFALFQNAQDPYSYFVGWEDIRGVSNSTEGTGDYNDVIFSFKTTQNPNIIVVTPEPATFSILGLGLLGMGLLRRKRSAK
jgi:hypothetical protein